MKFLFDDCNQYISRRGVPYLRLIALFAFVQESLDYQGPLDPFEEQFELPAVSIKCSYGQRQQDKVIASEYDFLTDLNFLESTAPKVPRIMLYSVKLVAQDRLISNNAARSTDLCRIYSAGVHAGFGMRGEESARLMQFIKTFEIQAAAIHDIDSSSSDWHKVQCIDFVRLVVADVNKLWDCATQVQQDQELCCTFDLAKWSPIEQAQTHSILVVSIA